MRPRWTQSPAAVAVLNALRPLEEEAAPEGGAQQQNGQEATEAEGRQLREELLKIEELQGPAGRDHFTCVCFVNALHIGAFEPAPSVH